MVGFGEEYRKTLWLERPRVGIYGSASPEEPARRLAWFHEYTARLEGQPPGLPLRCPCCGCKTLGERGAYEICSVCFWDLAMPAEFRILISGENSLSGKPIPLAPPISFWIYCRIASGRICATCSANISRADYRHTKNFPIQTQPAKSWRAPKKNSLTSSRHEVPLRIRQHHRPAERREIYPS